MKPEQLKIETAATVLQSFAYRSAYGRHLPLSPREKTLYDAAVDVLATYMTGVPLDRAKRTPIPPKALPARAMKVLREVGIATVEEVAALTPMQIDDLLGIQCCGVKTLEAIRQFSEASRTTAA